jgi:23S rRNA (uridine2552-2'-O)-methyltransferase
MASQYKRKDHFYLRAKEEGFASRAAYKLQELQKRHRLIKRRYRVLDLGAWPGGWTEVAAGLVGEAGLVVAVDLAQLNMADYPQVHCLRGDAGDEAAISHAADLVGGSFDVVLSDMSPKLTGIREVDDLATTDCAQTALCAAQMVLKSGGGFVAKLFKCQQAEQFVKSARPLFNRLVRNELSSSRQSSNEFYVVGIGFRAGTS